MMDISRLPDGLEDAYSELHAFVGHLDHLSEVHGGKDDPLCGTFYSLLLLGETIRDKFKAVIEGKPTVGDD